MDEIRLDDQPVGTPIDGGWRIKKNDAGTHYIDVLTMAFNYRIVLTPIEDPSVYDEFWCFAGKSYADLLRTVLAAMTWDGSTDTEPVGWNKNGQTQEWRAPQ